MGVLEGEENEKLKTYTFEKIVTENFLNLVKKIDIEVQEAQRVPNKMDTRVTHKNTSQLKCQRLKIKRI